MWTLIFLILLIGIIFLVFYLFFRDLKKYLMENKDKPVATVNFYKLRQLIYYFYIKNSYFKEKLGEEVLRGENETLRNEYISQQKFEKNQYKENMIKLFKTDFKKLREDMRKEEYLGITLLDFYFNLPDYIQSMKLKEETE